MIDMQVTAIRLQVGFPNSQRECAAHLYYQAFRQKLHPIFRDEKRAMAVLSASLQPDYAFTAQSNGHLVGIAGFKNRNGALLDIQPDTIIRIFGFIGGWIRLIALSIFVRNEAPDILLMDGIVVDQEVRGKGIGAALLDRVIEFAASYDYTSVRLDVVDSNPRARQLYERKGFVPVRSYRYPFLQSIFGFSGSTTMLYPIKP